MVGQGAPGQRASWPVRTRFKGAVIGPNMTFIGLRVVVVLVSSCDDARLGLPILILAA